MTLSPILGSALLGLVAGWTCALVAGRFDSDDASVPRTWSNAVFVAAFAFGAMALCYVYAGKPGTVACAGGLVAGVVFCLALKHVIGRRSAAG